VVHIGVGQHNRFNRTVAQALLGVQDRVLVDLLSEIGGGVEQHPVPFVGAYGKG